MYTSKIGQCQHMRTITTKLEKVSLYKYVKKLGCGQDGKQGLEREETYRHLSEPTVEISVAKHVSNVMFFCAREIIINFPVGWSPI